MHGTKKSDFKRPVFTCSPQNIPKLKTKNLHCAFCNKKFYVSDLRKLDGPHLPLLLQCGHAVCLYCAKTMNNGLCSYCSQEMKDISNSSLNLHVLGLLVLSNNRFHMKEPDMTFIANKSTNNIIKCSECQFLAAYDCRQCKLTLCDVCFSKIHSFKTKEEHVKNMLPGMDIIKRFLLPHSCSVSQCSEKPDYYCKKCEKSYCSHCMLRLHQNHDYSSLKEMNVNSLPQLDKSLTQLVENLQRHHIAQKKLISLRKDIKQKDFDDIEVHIIQQFARLYGVIQNLEEEILEKLEKHRTSLEKSFEDVHSQLDTQIREINNLMTIANSVKSNTDRVDMNEILKKVKEMSEAPCFILREINDDKGYCTDNIFNIDKNITSIIRDNVNLKLAKIDKISLLNREQLPEGYEVEELPDDTCLMVNESKLDNANKSSYEKEITSMITPTPQPEIFKIGVSMPVTVTHSNDPRHFFVRTSSMNEHFKNLCEMMKEQVPHMKSENCERKEDEICLLFDEKQKNWCRVKIIEVIENPDTATTYKVFLIDYGYHKYLVNQDSLLTLPSQLEYITPLCIKCCLYEAKPVGNKWSNFAVKYFNNFIKRSDITMSIIAIRGDYYEVNLMRTTKHDIDARISVREDLIRKGYAEATTLRQLMTKNPDLFFKFSFEKLQLYDRVECVCTFVDSLDFIYVQKAENINYIQRMTGKMTHEYNSKCDNQEKDIIENPEIGLACTAHGKDNRWYRAIISRLVDPKMVEVFLVDFGYKELIKRNKIRQLSNKFTNSDGQAIKILVQNLKTILDNRDEDSSSTTDYLKKILCNRKVEVIALQKNTDFYDAHVLPLKPQSPDSNLMNSKDEDIVFLKENNNLKNNYNGTTVRKLSKNDTEDLETFNIPVYVKKVETPYSIYLAIKSREDEINDMYKTLQEFYNNYCSNKKTQWEVNDICVAYSSKDKMFHRVKIIEKKTDENVLAFFIDAGYEEMISLKNIQPMHEKFQAISAYLFKVKLGGIYPCGGTKQWATYSCDKLKDVYQTNQDCRFYISKYPEDDETCISVELWMEQRKIENPLAPTVIKLISLNQYLMNEGVALSKKTDGNLNNVNHTLASDLQQLIELQRKDEVVNKNFSWFSIKSNETVEFLNNDKKSDKTNISKDLNIDHNVNLNQELCKDESYEYIKLSQYDLSKIDIPPKNSSWLPPTNISKISFLATPTYVADDGVIYIQTLEHNKRIVNDIKEKLQEVYKDIQVDPETEWSPGDLCIVRYHLDDKWYRGVVVSSDTKKINVKFVDYGNIETYDPTRLMKKVILGNIPIQCTKCIVKGLQLVDHGRFNIEQLNIITDLVVDNVCLITILKRPKSSEKCLIVSIKLITPNAKDLCSHLNEVYDMKLISYQFNEKDNINFLSDDYGSDDSDSSISVIDKRPETPIVTDIELEDGDECSTSEICNIKKIPLIEYLEDSEYVEVELSAARSPIEYYCQLKENIKSKVLNIQYQKYQNLLKDIQANIHNQSLITEISANTYCCVKFVDDNNWYRCRIERCIDDEQSKTQLVLLYYIDYGNREQRIVDLNNHEFYTMKKEWFDTPAMAFKFKFLNIKDYSSDEVLLTEYLEDNFYGKKFFAKIKERHDDLFIGEIFYDEKCTQLIYAQLIETELFYLEDKAKE